MDSSIWLRLALIAIAGAVTYVTGIVIYRLYLSPLAGFPGPKLAAASHLVEIYYDIFQGGGGRLPFIHQKWHSLYGPIIRINPDELHIQDAAFFDTLYSASRPAWKMKNFFRRFNQDKSSGGTEDPTHYRVRRTALNPFFSRRKVADCGPQIQRNMQKIISRIQTDYATENTVQNIKRLWECYGADNVIGFCFDEHYDFISTPDFHSTVNDAMNTLVEKSHWLWHFPVLVHALLLLPDNFLGQMAPKMKPVLQLWQVGHPPPPCCKHTHDRLQDLGNKIEDVLATTHSGDSADATVFTSLIHQGLPPEELEYDRLHQEAKAIIGAGVETIARSLTVACFHIIDQPEVRDRLMTKLRLAIPEPLKTPSWDDLVKLPYLSASIDEAMRLTYGISQRRPRGCAEPLIYGRWKIPPHTMVSMDNYAVSHDENIFPNSFDFIRDRWFGTAKAPDGRSLRRYLISFGKGTRNCLGMELAYAQLYIALANFFRWPTAAAAALFETTKADVEMRRDMFIPRRMRSSKGVRVVFQGVSP